MKKTIHLFFAASLFFTQQCLHAGFVSLTRYEKENENRKAFIIGDVHYNPKSPIETIDVEHKKNLFSTLHTLAMQKKPIKMFIESEKNARQKYLQLHGNAIMNEADKSYKLSLIAVAEFAEKNNYHYKSIEFYPFDLRTDEITTPVMCLDILLDFEIHYLAGVANLEYKLIPDISVADYLNKLKIIKKKLTGTQDYNQLNENIKIIKQFMKTYKNSDNQKVKELFIQYFQKDFLLNIENCKKFSEISHAVNQLIPQNLGNASLELSLQKSINEESDILIFTGFGHTKTADFFLKNNGYAHMETVGVPIDKHLKILDNSVDYYETDDLDFCRSDEVKSFFSKLTQKQTCENCDEKSSKHCKKCKVAKYCSADCQKTDWNYHKLFCKKIAGEKLTN